MSVEVTPAVEADLPELAGVAAQHVPAGLSAFGDTRECRHLHRREPVDHPLREYLADPDRMVLAARSGNRILGYAMLIRGVADDPDVQRAVIPRPAVELSKMYVLPDDHGAASPAP